jgi:hypothetical protein
MLAEKVQELVSDAMAGDTASVLALVCFTGIYLLVTFYLLQQLMAREGSAGKKVFWGLVLFIPLLGWAFYLAFYKVPPSQCFR